MSVYDIWKCITKVIPLHCDGLRRGAFMHYTLTHTSTQTHTAISAPSTSLSPAAFLVRKVKMSLCWSVITKGGRFVHLLFKNWRIWTVSSKEITLNVGNPLKTKCRMQGRMQFIFASDIKGIKHLKPLFTYLEMSHCHYWCFGAVEHTVPIIIRFWEQMKAWAVEPSPPVSHTMNHLHVEVEETVMRRFLHNKWKNASMGAWSSPTINCLLE